MKIGMIGLGRMGEGMSRRLIAAGHVVHGYRKNYEKSSEQYEKGYISGCTTSIKYLVDVIKSKEVFGIESGENVSVETPGVFMMVVPAETVEDTLNELLQYCVAGDIIIDHGNSNFKDSRRRAERLSKLGIQYIDCGTSGGVYGLERGYCLMVGGAITAVHSCAPIFRALAPGITAATRTDPYSRATSAEYGWLHCGGPGAGHFVKMVHNGVEYGMMQAYAEGFNILHEANSGEAYVVGGDAEVAPMENPADYQYDIDVAEVAELWRRGSVVGSWLLDLTSDVLRHDHNDLKQFEGGVSDSGEGRWTVHAAVDLGVPTPVISAALFERFNSRRLGQYANKILNGMRYMFGGHNVR